MSKVNLYPLVLHFSKTKAPGLSCSSKKKNAMSLVTLLRSAGRRRRNKEIHGDVFGGHQRQGTTVVGDAHGGEIRVQASDRDGCNVEFDNDLVPFPRSFFVFF